MTEVDAWRCLRVMRVEADRYREAAVPSVFDVAAFRESKGQFRHRIEVHNEIWTPPFGHKPVAMGVDIKIGPVYGIVRTQIAALAGTALKSQEWHREFPLLLILMNKE